MTKEGITVRTPAAPLRPLAIRGGFALFELVATLLLIAFLGSVWASALGRLGSGTKSFQCLSNQKRLVAAWRMYAEDNRDNLPFASGTSASAAPYVWVKGVIDSGPSAPGNWNYDATIRLGVIWPYCGGSTAIWHCPADTAVTINPQGQRVPRVRSVSMSNWVGGNGDSPPTYKGAWGLNSPSIVYRRVSQMLRPGPAGTFVILDERQDSINDGYFVTEMDGYPNPTSTRIVDYPAAYHNRGAGFGFADGHSEIHRWRDLRTTPPPFTQPPLNVPNPNNQDVVWMQKHCSLP